MAERLKSLLAHGVGGLSGVCQATGVIVLGLAAKEVDVDCSSPQSTLCICNCGHKTWKEKGNKTKHFFGECV